MRGLVDAIASGNSALVREILEKKLYELAREKADSLKVCITEELFGDVDNELTFDFVDALDEKAGNVQKMGRMKLIRVRVRKGKIQRRKRFAAVKGYTLRGGKVVRMSPQERMHRKRGARKAKIKRRGKLRQALRKRKISLRKRKSLGL